MGVYIKGMDKHPCLFCEFRTWEPVDTLYYCLITKRGLPKDEIVPDWCPLVEVKTPHGRLIDAGELLKWADANPLTEDGGIDINDFEEYFDNAPTIIEAEEE